MEARPLSQGAGGEGKEGKATISVTWLLVGCCPGRICGSWISSFPRPPAPAPATAASSLSPRPNKWPRHRLNTGRQMPPLCLFDETEYHNHGEGGSCILDGRGVFDCMRVPSSPGSCFVPLPRRPRPPAASAPLCLLCLPCLPSLPSTRRARAARPSSAAEWEWRKGVRKWGAGPIIDDAFSPPSQPPFTGLSFSPAK